MDIQELLENIKIMVVRRGRGEGRRNKEEKGRRRGRVEKEIPQSSPQNPLFGWHSFDSRVRLPPLLLLLIKEDLHR